MARSLLPWQEEELEGRPSEEEEEAPAGRPAEALVAAEACHLGVVAPSPASGHSTDPSSSRGRSMNQVEILAVAEVLALPQ